jgi:hypothetical protein
VLESFDISYHMRGSRKVRFPIFYLEYKAVTVSNTWVRYRHICSIFLYAVAVSVETLSQR